MQHVSCQSVKWVSVKHFDVVADAAVVGVAAVVELATDLFHLSEI